MCDARGYAVSFEPVRPGSVVCRAVKGASQFQVLATSVSEGLRELARLLVMNLAWQINR
jgi:hypothetical protein